MRTKAFRFFLLLLVIATSRAHAQQDPQFTQYMFNTLYYNPGFAGVEGVTKMSLLYRSQWTGYTQTNGGGGAPSTFIVSATTPLLKLNSGVGLHIVNDQLGPLTNQEIQGSYAYHLAVKDAKLSFGIRAGVFAQTIGANVYHPIQPGDPAIPKDGSSQIRPDIAAGMFYRKEKYYVGLSINHLTKPSFDFGTSYRSPLKPHLYVTGGYYYDLNFDVKLHFTSLIQSDFAKSTVNVSGLAYFRDTMWGGLAFRQSEAATLMLGYTLLKDKSLKLGYALDYVIKDQAAKQPTSHEFMITYEFPPVPAVGKKVIRTPRYRH